MRLYSTPIFSLNGLYKKNNIRDFIGFFRKKKNVDGKINFLEDFCTKQDKSGFTPKDMVVKNSKLKLKLLEQHYKNFMEDYACYF